LELDVEGARALVAAVPQIAQRARVAGGPLRLRDAKRFERFGSNDPGRDRAAEILAKKRTEGRHLPELDVARRPVVDKSEAEDVLACFADRNWLALPVARPDPHRQFELVIEIAARPEARRGLVRHHVLPGRAPHR